MDAQTQAFLAKLAAENRELRRQMGEVAAEYKAVKMVMAAQPKSITNELDSIPGRRIFYNLSGVLPFDISNAGNRAQPINFLVSQDGPFIMTHYPDVAWSPIAPANATHFGEWSPPYSWPLPTQQVGGDIIDIAWELVSGGSQRNFQNLPAVPLFSRPDTAIPLAVPTLFAPNEVIQFFATFNSIAFDAAAQVPTVQGQLVVTLPGYRVVNL